MCRKDEQVTVAIKKHQPEGKVVRGKVLGTFRKAQFAQHDLPKLARAQNINVESLGIFRGDDLVPEQELLVTPKPAPQKMVPAMA